MYPHFSSWVAGAYLKNVKEKVKEAGYTLGWSQVRLRASVRQMKQTTIHIHSHAGTV